MKADKKRKTKNPLAHARGNQNDAENVWFRRSGGGLQLFVQYYLGQPLGVVCEEAPSSPAGGVAIEHNCNQEEEVDNFTGCKRKKGGHGQSRASKRRKRKKSKNTSDKNNGTGQSTIKTDGNDNMGEARTSIDSNNNNNNRNKYPLMKEMEKCLRDKQKKTKGTGVETELASEITIRPFFEAMSMPLPLTFRIRKGQEGTSTGDVPRIVAEKYASIISPISFCKDIYQGIPGLTKESLGSVSSSLKQFLIEHSQDGTLARQEVGSMLPVLALERIGALKRSSKVVDMCASPGSKTLQALEVIVGPAPEMNNNTSQKKKGRIIANDVLESRLATLEDAVNRSGMAESETDRIRYSCQDATKLALPAKADWDCIIADVPCSGDGTVRKDKHILPMWQPNQGNQLHETQLKILIRALELVRVGGVVCYSTCSLNPVEDEAVVAAALRRMNSCVDTNKGNLVQPVIELIEFPSVPEFLRRPGVSTWRIADYDEESRSSGNEEDAEETHHLRWHETWEDAVHVGMNPALESMWPHDDIVDMNLDRCTRLLPQIHDTGGFFLALIRKNKRTT